MRSERDVTPEAQAGVGADGPSDDQEAVAEALLEDDPKDLGIIASISLWVLPPLGIGLVAASGEALNSLTALVVGAQLVTVFILVVGLRVWGVDRWVPIAVSAIVAGLLLVVVGEPRLIGEDLPDSAKSEAEQIDPGADVRGENFDGANLRGRTLSNIEASGASFRGANMAATQLIAADLSGADLTGVDLSGADLRGARLLGTDLRHACLRGTNLSGARLDGAQVVGSDVTDAVLPSDGVARAASWPVQKGGSSACEQ